MIFLPHTNTVILLERYCGTITEPGLPVDTHADVRQVESLIRVFRYAKRHKHPLIFATGLKSRTNQVQTAGTIEEIRPGGLAWVWHAACASTVLWTAYNYKVFYAFLFFTEWSTRCPAQIQSGSLVGYWVQRNACPHKMCMKMCISVIPCFSLNWWCGWGDL